MTYLNMVHTFRYLSKVPKKIFEFTSCTGSPEGSPTTGRRDVTLPIIYNYLPLAQVKPASDAFFRGACAAQCSAMPSARLIELFASKPGALLHGAGWAAYRQLIARYRAVLA